jgi:predicted nucleic acid-binding protein
VILCDTGPLVSAALTNEKHHVACVDLLARLRGERQHLALPATVLAEVGYMLDRELGPDAEARFVDGVAAGDFELIHLTKDDLTRMGELIRQYDDMPLGTTDASVIAVAERLGVSEIATLDHRHFWAVRPRHVAAFTLLP